MKFRNTWVVAILFAAFAGYLYFVERPRHEQAAADRKLLAFQPDDAAGVTLTYPDRQIVLQKVDGAWKIVQPIQYEADETTVKNLLQAIPDAEVKRTLDEDLASVEEYGLDKPVAIVTVALKDGKTLPAIRVGKTAPVGFSAYVQIEGSPEVKIVGSVFQTGMKKEVKDLRSKTIIDFQDDDVQRIEVTAEGSTVELARDGAKWNIEKPEKLAADENEVRTFLSSLRGLRAQDFVDQPAALSEYGLDAPREKIAVLVGKDKTRQELWIGDEQQHDSTKDLYVKREGADLVFAVGTWAWNGLNKNVSAFRDKTVLAFDKDGADAIEVARGDGETFRLVRKGAPQAATPPATPTAASWTLEGVPNPKATQIDQLVGDLHALKGYEIAAESPKSLADYGLDDPDVTYSLIDATGKPIGRVLLAKTGSGSEAVPYAMAEGGKVVFKVRDYLYSHLDKRKTDLVETPAAPAGTPAAPADAADAEEESD